MIKTIIRLPSFFFWPLVILALLLIWIVSSILLGWVNIPVMFAVGWFVGKLIAERHNDGYQCDKEYWDN